MMKTAKRPLLRDVGGMQKAFTIIELLGVMAIIAVLLAILLPATRGGREPVRRMVCSNNLRQIALALHNYESVYRRLPPAYTVDADGNRLHSWRTLILPFLEQEALYQSIDLRKPWNDPVNAKARSTVIDFYRCSSLDSKDSKTTYLALAGEDFALKFEEGRKFKEIKDGLSQTVMVIEADVDQAVEWMSPNDMEESNLEDLSPKSKTAHRGVRMCAMADGSVQSLPVDTSFATLRALASIDAGDDARLDD